VDTPSILQFVIFQLLLEEAIRKGINMFLSLVRRLDLSGWYACRVKRVFLTACLSMGWMIAAAVLASGEELAGDTLRVELGVNSQGIPVVEGAQWTASGLPAFNEVSSDGLDSWLAGQSIASDAGDPDGWAISTNGVLLTGQATRTLASGLKITWIVELTKNGSLLRLHVQLLNTAEGSRAVDSFPIWTGSWQVPAGPRWMRWWDSITYQPQIKDVTSGGKATLGSHLYSSADNGQNPYWILGAGAGRFYYSLEWSGGWQAKLKAQQDVFSFSVNLPPDEAQLVMKRNQMIEGPALIVWATPQRDDAFSRRSWMGARLALAKQIYGGPAPSFRLIYNHWYAIRGDVDGAFLSRQIPAMSVYGFYSFVVDLGWFDNISDWQPDPVKFASGEFQSLLQSARSNGATVGLWSTPQFISEGDQSTSQRADSPPDFSDFLGGYLLDLWGSDYQTRLTNHLELLRSRHSIDWWKYDQPLFQDQSRSGAMKNAIAFQGALKAARAANPSLIIENCMDGGHIINDFTLLCTQISWLADGKNNDLDQVRTNIQGSLGALDFIFPGAIERSTNRLDELDGNDELTRCYCRSAMAGTWWISTDLPLLSDHQRELVLKEIANYRQLNLVKQDGLYSLHQPQDGADIAGVTFYNWKSTKAGVLRYRWDRQGEFTETVSLKGLKSSLSYTITDADSGIQTQVSGKDLMKNGLAVPFAAERMSALLFIEASN
jgi:hypothetical protein